MPASRREACLPLSPLRLLARCSLSLLRTGCSMPRLRLPKNRRKPGLDPNVRQAIERLRSAQAEAKARSTRLTHRRMGGAADPIAQRLDDVGPRLFVIERDHVLDRGDKRAAALPFAGRTRPCRAPGLLDRAQRDRPDMGEEHFFMRAGQRLDGLPPP